MKKKKRPQIKQNKIQTPVCNQTKKNKIGWSKITQMQTKQQNNTY